MSSESHDAVAPLPIRITTARWVLRGYVVIASLGIILHVYIAQTSHLHILWINMISMGIILGAGLVSLRLLNHSLSLAMHLNSWVGMVCVWGMVIYALRANPQDSISIIYMFHANILALGLILGFKPALRYSLVATPFLLSIGIIYSNRFEDVIALIIIAYAIALPSKLVEQLIKESTAELTTINTRLNEEVAERKRAEEDLKNHRDHLEDMVAERIADLAASNHHMREGIAEREQAEKALRESEALYRSLVETSPDVIALSDLNGTILFCSQQAVAMYGIESMEEAVGKNVFEFAAPEDVPRAMENMRKTLETGNVRNIEYTMLRKDGSRVPVEVSASLVFDAEGRPQSFIGLTRDITQRKQAEKALKESEERFRAVSELVSDFAYSVRVEADGAIVPEWETIASSHVTGYTPEEVVERGGWQVLLHPDDMPLAFQHLQTHLGGQPDVQEYRIITKSGEIRWLRDYGRPVWDEAQGRVVRILGAAQDITKRKQVEAALRESENRYKLVTELMSDYIFKLAVDADGRVAADMVTDNFFTLTGQTLQKVQPPDLWAKIIQIIHPDDLGNLMALMQTLVTAGGSVETECRSFVQEGHLRWVHVVAQAVLDQEKRRTVAIVGAVKDITERKRAEEALRESEEKFRGFIVQSSEGISLADEQGRIVEWNQAMEHLLGLKRDQVIGMPVWDVQFCVLPPEQRVPQRYESSKARLLNALRTGQSHAFDHVIEAELCRVDGEKKIIQQSAFPIRTDKGYRMGSVLRDITERKQAEEALRQYAVELEARNQDLDAFGHTVAHDIKGSLTHVIGNAEMLEINYDKMPEPEIETCLRSIVQGGRRINNIVDELMLLAGVRKAEVESKPLDMANFVAGALQRLADMVERSHAEIVLPPASAWPVALGYGPWIEEVWVNYISNAIQYGGRPPRLELGADPLPAALPQAEEAIGSANRSGGVVRFWVRDNGAGIAPEDQARLFTPFTQLNQIRAKGHGLGLSIVRRIVEKLGGQVGVESQVGQGSVFSFTLPSAPTET